MKLFIVVIAAVPKQNGNCVATKVQAVCLRASRAEAFAQIAKESTGSVVYGLECNVYTKVVPWDLEVQSVPPEIFVIMKIAIPVEEGRPPTQANVYKVCLSTEEAENTFREIAGQKIDVGGVPCEVQSSIIRTKVDTT